MRKIASAILFLLVAGFPAKALTTDTDSLIRRIETFESLCSPEKLYLHVDRTYFSAGETLWFNGYLRNAMANSLLVESNFIYVELLDKSGNAVARVKVKRNDGIFPGSISIPEHLSSGEYTLRAYTLWQLNGSEDYMFNQKVRVLGAVPPKKSEDTQAGDIDISFYPEGGRYFSGTSSTLGFKVLDSKGRSVEMSAKLISSGGDVVKDVSTVFDGMGRISFIPIAGETYSLRTPDGRLFPLPEPSVDGATLNLRFNGENTIVSFYGNIRRDALIFLGNSSGMARLALIPAETRQKVFRIGSELLCPGINHIIVTDGTQILSERMFFVYDSKEVNCSLDKVSISHAPCKPLKAEFSLKDIDGGALDGHFSVSVSRASFKNFRQDDGLVSYMSLSSELKGHINNPMAYFDSTVPIADRKNRMDLLMLIQGWRYYDYNSILNSRENFNIRYLKEYKQSLSGRIANGRSKKMPKDFIFSLIVPDLKLTRFLKVGQADGFVIDSLDFPENTQFLISITRSGLGREYAPRWSGDRLAAPYLYTAAPGVSSAKVEEEIPLVYEGMVLDTLNAAVVTASSGEEFENIFGNSVSGEDLKNYSNYSLIQYLLMRTPRFEFNGEYMYNKSQQSGFASSSTEEDSLTESGTSDSFTSEDDVPGKVKLIADGEDSPWWVYEYVEVGELSSINISTEPDSFYNSEGGLVTIHLRPGTRLDDVSTRESLLFFIPLGYQKPSAFYSPRYDLGDAHEIYDHRNTIYWAPDVKVSDGKAEIVFCDTDQQDYPYYVHVEGVTSDGRMFSTRTVIK